MVMDRSYGTEKSNAGEGHSRAEFIEQLTRFDGPPEEFLARLLAVQCCIASAEEGVLFRVGPSGRPEILAVHPRLEKEASPPVWLAVAIESAPAAMRAAKTTFKPLHQQHDLYGAPPKTHLVTVPLKGQSGVRGLAAFVVEAQDTAALQAARERLELTTSLLSLYEMRLTLQQRQMDFRRLRTAMETLTAVNEHDRFAGAAMTLCNEIASRWMCERVGLGFLKGRYVHLKALSHTEKFSRKMKLVQDIESAMEECLDQDVEVLYPAAKDAGYVSHMSEELSRRHGPHTSISIPLRRDKTPTAVLTLERPSDKPFQLEDVEALRLTADLCTARIASLYTHDRWFGARWAASVRKGASLLVGPQHTWAKLAGIAATALLIFLIFAKGTYKAEGSFVIEARELQVVSAPFEGLLKEVDVEPGQKVEEGQRMARLDTPLLDFHLAASRAEKLGYERQRDAALRDRKMAEAKIAQAQADKVDAEIRRLEYRWEQAEIVSPIAGTVVRGDLKRQIGDPKETGDVLFEVAPIENLRAVISIPEDQIADVAKGQTGQLAAACDPASKIRFVVERIDPIAQVVDQKNVFQVYVRLDDAPSWLLPGMEGVAKIEVREARYVWIWSRTLVNWVRMKLWF